MTCRAHLSLSDSIGLLLRCSPGEFRDEYEREMLQAFRDQLGEDRRIGFRSVFGSWRQVFADSIVRALGEHLDVLQHDVRYAMRSLRRAPLFAMTAIATLALGVGANTAIFSVVQEIHGPLPVRWRLSERRHCWPATSRPAARRGSILSPLCERTELACTRAALIVTCAHVRDSLSPPAYQRGLFSTSAVESD